MNPIMQGLIISGVGILILFAFASVFYLLIVGLQRLFPEKEMEPAVEVAAVKPVEMAVETSEEDAVVAAVAVTLARARARAQSSLGNAIHDGRGSWWSANLLTSRDLNRHKN